MSVVRDIGIGIVSGVVATVLITTLNTLVFVPAISVCKNITVSYEKDGVLLREDEILSNINAKPIFRLKLINHGLRAAADVDIEFHRIRKSFGTETNLAYKIPLVRESLNLLPRRGDNEFVARVSSRDRNGDGIWSNDLFRLARNVLEPQFRLRVFAQDPISGSRKSTTHLFDLEDIVFGRFDEKGCNIQTRL